MDIRRIHTVIDEVRTEGTRPVTPVAKIAVVSAVFTNPWWQQGFVEDLNETIDVYAPQLGSLLTPLVINALDVSPEAYGKAAIVGLDGEIEHGSALIHTLLFGDQFRKAASATTLLPAVEKRGQAGVSFDIPLKHITDQTIRSHHQSIEVSVPDAPHPDEIIVSLAAAARGRPQERLSPLTITE